MIVSVIYVSNYVEARKEQVTLSTSNAVSGKPWLALGDFNQVLSPYEHSRSVNMIVDKRTIEFRQCLLDADLTDLNYRVNTFTWWNKSKTRPVAKKIDRILVNDQWFDVFPSAVAFFGSPDFSDHASLSVILDLLDQKLKKPFKFTTFC